MSCMNEHLSGCVLHDHKIFDRGKKLNNLVLTYAWAFKLVPKFSQGVVKALLFCCGILVGLKQILKQNSREKEKTLIPTC